MRSFLTIFLLFICFSTNANTFKKAIKLIEKGKYEKAYTLVDKSRQKVPINPGANYVFSVLYLDTNFPNYSEDSSWYYIILAEQHLNELDEKSSKKLLKSGIDSELIALQKSIVDSAVFSSTLERNTISEYEEFIGEHPQSPFITEAVSRRDVLAWEKAKAEDTYQSYLQFIKKYPESNQAKEAKELYEVLLYEEKTNDNNLTSYIQFLKDFPDSPYRLEAEKHIFNLGAAGTGSSGYLWFLKNYPESQLAGKAVNFLYHLYKEENDPVGFYNHYDIPNSDSLIQVIELEYVKLFPVYDNGKFGYYDVNWNKIIDHQFNQVDPDHLCGLVENDFLVVKRGENDLILGKSGNTVFEGKFEKVEDLGCGFLKVQRNGKYAALHKSGYIILDFEFEDLDILNNRFIKFYKDGNWGIASFTGLVMLQNEYDQINGMNDMVLIEKGGKTALINSDNIVHNIEKKMPNLKFVYDDVEVIDEKHLLAIQGNKETLLGEGAKVIIPLSTHRIYPFINGWIGKENDLFKAFSSTGVQIFDTVFSQATYNERWLALKKNNKWVFFGDERTFAEGFIYDSINLLSPNFAYINAFGKHSIYFNSKGPIEISSNSRVRVLRPSTWNKNEKPKEYIIVMEGRNKKMVYDTLGQLILEGVYDQVLPLGNDYLMIEVGGRKGLIDFKGNILIKPYYEAIGNYNQGFVSLLKSRKFGVYNQRLNMLIPPQFDVMLRPFTDSLMMANVDDKWGLVDVNNNQVLDFNYKEIQAWNDHQVLVKTMDDLYSIIDLKSKHIIYSGIETYKLLKNEKDEKIAVVLKRSQHGVISSKHGEIISPGFTDIINLGTTDNPIYFAQRTIREAEFIVAVYYSADGQILKRLAMTEDEFDNVYCE